MLLPAAHALSAGLLTESVVFPAASSAAAPGILGSPGLLAAIAGISALAGAVNSIAGGGTLLTFPALVGMGIPPLVANATNSIALWPGALASMWGYIGELRGSRKWAIGFALPSLAGGLVGALLLTVTPPGLFDTIVPWLVLGATALFVAQVPIARHASARRLRESGEPAGSTADAEGARRDGELTGHFPGAAVLTYQFLVSIYGGYFGASRGILMLAALGLMGLSNIHRMNGLKNWGSFCMAASAAVTFAFTDLVDWWIVLAMTVGSVAGGYGGARLAQRVPQDAVRRMIVVIGVASGIWMLLR